MAKILVSLVGKERAPNVQFISQYKSKVDKYIFISSPESEQNNYTQAILDASKISENFIILQANANIFEGTSRLLEGLDFQEEDKFIINLTGGTKMMALGCWLFFTQNKFSQKSEIFYSPIFNGDTYLQIYPDNKSEIFTENISVSDYLKGYNLKIESISQPFKDKAKTEKYLKNILDNNTESIYEVIEKLQKRRDNKKIQITEIQGLNEYLNQIDFLPLTQGILSQKEIKYLTGACFEEWTYFKIKTYFESRNLKFDIAFSVNITQSAQNDFDVIFIYQNKIYVVECKTFIDEKILKDTTIYKSGSLKSRFGLSVKSLLFTLSDLRNTEGHFKPALEKRAKAENVILADKNTLWEQEKFDNFFTQSL